LASYVGFGSYFFFLQKFLGSLLALSNTLHIIWEPRNTLSGLAGSNIQTTKKIANLAGGGGENPYFHTAGRVWRAVRWGRSPASTSDGFLVL